MKSVEYRRVRAYIDQMADVLVQQLVRVFHHVTDTADLERHKGHAGRLDTRGVRAGGGRGGIGSQAQTFSAFIQANGQRERRPVYHCTSDAPGEAALKDQAR